MASRTCWTVSMVVMAPSEKAGRMLLLDVNVLVYAFRPDQSTSARATRDWLDRTMTAGQPVAVTEESLVATIRISTHPGIFEQPAPPRDALAFVEALRDAPLTRVLRPSSRHWAIFRAFVDDLRLVGNDVPDASLAALAIDRGAALVTTDRGFRRFPGLSTLDPTLPA